MQPLTYKQYSHIKKGLCEGCEKDLTDIRTTAATGDIFSHWLDNRNIMKCAANTFREKFSGGLVDDHREMDCPKCGRVPGYGYDEHVANCTEAALDPTLSVLAYKTKNKPDLYPRLRVYTASKLPHAKRWIDLRSAWPEIQFTARWPDLVGHIPDEREAARVFWLQDIQDVRCSDVVMVFAEGNEHLRGALVEVGAALAFGLQVLAVGYHADYGTWYHHPQVNWTANLTTARGVLEMLAKKIHPKLPEICKTCNGTKIEKYLTESWPAGSLSAVLVDATRRCRACKE